MIDTHAHLHAPEFDADRERVLTRDFAAGITGIVEVCISRARWPEVERLAADPRIAITAGIHPHEAARAGEADAWAIEPLLARPEVVAVGETGLDLARDYAPLAEQEKLFAAQIRLARATAKPLVVHCRAAFDEVFRCLDREGRGAVTGVFHCFSGDAARARETLARGFALGLGGAVTYAPDRWREVLAGLPIERLLLETDCPYLRPDPERRGRNEPACVFRVAEVVAELIGIETEALIAAADRNAEELFRTRFPRWEGRP